MLLQDFLTISRERTPDKTAIVSGEVRLSYAGLDDGANRAGNGLVRRGVRRGDRVLIFTRDRATAVVCLYGTLRAGAIFTIVPDTTPAAYLHRLIESTEPAAIIADHELLPVLREAGVGGALPAGTILTRAGDENIPSLDDFRALSSGHPPVRPIDLDLASLVFTSGSRGVPKGIMLTHLNMVAAARAITSYLGNTPDDIILSVLPLSFDYGLYQVLMAVMSGGTVVIEPSFAYPVHLLRHIREERVTAFPILPTICALLEKFSIFRESTFPTVRYVTNTGAALPIPCIQALRRSFPAARIFSMYGLSECKRVSYLPPEELDHRPASVGKPMPDCEVWIEDDEGRILPDGETGELIVRGSNVALGYWRMPEETARTFRPGPLPGERLLHTGDLFRTDGDGYLYFVGRRDDMLKCRGRKVSPREIEDAAFGFPGVIDAVAVGYPDEVLGQAVRLYLVFEDGREQPPAEVKRYLQSMLEEFKVPSEIEIRRELPRNASGKVDRLALGSAAREGREPFPPEIAHSFTGIPLRKASE